MRCARPRRGGDAEFAASPRRQNSRAVLAQGMPATGRLRQRRDHRGAARDLELNIGHYMIGEAIFGGLGAVVRSMRAAMDRGRARSQAAARA
jgi:hypothetical protein